MVSNDGKNPGRLGYIGNCTTRLYRVYLLFTSKTILRIPIDQPGFNGKKEKDGFFVAQICSYSLNVKWGGKCQLSKGNSCNPFQTRKPLIFEHMLFEILPLSFIFFEKWD